MLAPESGMRRVQWEDKAGRTWVALVPEDAKDSQAHRYPRQGPPAIADLLVANGWPEDPARAVQAELATVGIVTREEARTPEGRTAIGAALRHALNIDAQRVIDAYMEA